VLSVAQKGFPCPLVRRRDSDPRCDRYYPAWQKKTSRWSSVPKKGSSVPTPKGTGKHGATPSRRLFGGRDPSPVEGGTCAAVKKGIGTIVRAQKRSVRALLT
jgi:hypothetical protein